MIVGEIMEVGEKMLETVVAEMMMEVLMVITAKSPYLAASTVFSHIAPSQQLLLGPFCR